MMSEDRYRWRTFVCRHVESGQLPVRAVLWDSGKDGDGAYLFVGCGHGNDQHPPGSLVVMAWGCCCERWPELVQVDASLAPDTWQTRSAPGQPWVLEHHDELDAADPAAAPPT